MEQAIRERILGIRFSKVGKVYHFKATHLDEVKIRDAVVVETSRGWQIGEVAQVLDSPERPPEGGWKSVDRLATPRDLLLRQLWQLRELDVVEACKKRAAEIRIQNIKIVAAEYSFDGARLTILYSTEAEEKVDLKSLRADMQRQFSPAVVEMRQIGPRDVAKIIGGMGACGLETRCCSQFLTDFSSISIRMAKEQGISLTPTEITGMCGRLRCCLIYEYSNYAEARKGMPKRNKRVMTPLGEGKVVDISPLAGTMRIDIPEVGVREFSREELYTFLQSQGESGKLPDEVESESEEEIPESSPESVEQAVEPQSSKPRHKPRGGGRSGRRRRGPRRT